MFTVGPIPQINSSLVRGRFLFGEKRLFSDSKIANKFMILKCKFYTKTYKNNKIKKVLAG
jgi:hypothetical protein